MAKLKAKNRKHIKASNFAVPKGKGSKPGTNSYPVHDAPHARNALARVNRFGTPAEKRAVRNKVARNFPGIGQSTAATKKTASKAKASTKRGPVKKKATAKRGKR